MPILRTNDGIERNPLIKTHQPSVMLDRQSQQIDIDELARTVDSLWIDHAAIEQADGV